MSTILLLVISLLAPWMVHLAPPRQRPLALVGVVAVFLLYGIFAENPLMQWEMWAGPRRRHPHGALPGGRRRRSGGGRVHAAHAARRLRQRARFDDGNEPTGEI